MPRDALKAWGHHPRHPPNGGLCGWALLDGPGRLHAVQPAFLRRGCGTQGDK